ncbi:UPF0160 protein C27H6.8 like [Verticillium longisporum]|nr:UPF0160 protein C27H6.8 like [Verticillium longisporum]
MGTAEDSPDVALLHNKFYESFVEALDAHDNGISVYDPAAVSAAGLEKRFSEGGFTLGAMVGRFNGNWNDAVVADPEQAQAAEDKRFEAASARIGEVFDRDLQYYAKAWLPARAVVKAAFDARAQHDPEGRILVFDGVSAPWKDHLYSLEEGKPTVLYVLYPEKPVPGAKWRVQTVPVAKDSFQSRKPLPEIWRGFRDQELDGITGIDGCVFTVPVTKDSFQSRKPLPEAWRGFRDQELDGIAGIDGCVFVHAAGFIGGNATFEGALAMATKALTS